ncbi:hypothetical protein Pyrde_2040 [Pyrodictium delaneyi]|uniref:DUF3800 domain-containing protein n=1 Tax=Pyrodictium delaneyi TaxID=1273541 RepID=A0A0P0N694_9CREN|nr:DUF3800 domain-containing protein [Pyrodictium delaneyi]ALL02083.1 hypothetical protein Pyrde_2040 [Pyrodictium delaneyi]
MGSQSRRVLLAYVDESGKPHQLREGPFVVTAAMIWPEELRAAEEKIHGFLKYWERRLKEHHPNMEIPPLEEIHARTVVMGEGFWRGVKPRLRNEFILGAADLVGHLPVVFNIVVLRMEPGAPLDPHRVRYEVHKRLIERIVMTDPRVDEIVVKYDSAGFENHGIAVELLRGLHEGYVQYRGEVSIGFVDSRRSPLIQAADLMAYVTRMVEMGRYLVRGIEIDRAFILLEPRIRRCPHSNDYEGCGLKRATLHRDGRIR